MHVNLDNLPSVSLPLKIDFGFLFKKYNMPIRHASVFVFRRLMMGGERKAPYMDASLEIYSRVADLLGRMSLPANIRRMSMTMIGKLFDGGVSRKLSQAKTP